MANVGGTFIVSYTAIQPTGTGVIDPFLTIQNNGQESGYNTSAGTPLDTKAGQSGRTQAVQLGQLGAITIGGTSYYQFLVDVNQANGNGPISLNQVQFFTSASQAGLTSNFTSSPSTTTNAVINIPNLTQVFQMSAAARSGTSYEVQIAGGHGSGSGDLFLYVPTADFSGGPNTYVTMFTQFGAPPGFYESNAGFEEWAFRSGTSAAVPEPATLVPALMGLVPLAWVGIRRYRRRSEDIGSA